jgi:hypothetical protein
MLRTFGEFDEKHPLGFRQALRRLDGRTRGDNRRKGYGS